MGHEDERIESDLENLRGEKLPYLSLLIVKKKSGGAEKIVAGPE